MSLSNILNIYFYGLFNLVITEGSSKVYGIRVQRSPEGGIRDRSLGIRDHGLGIRISAVFHRTRDQTDS